ncbi:hypothetical protein PP410_gp44 [Vibrio phage NF]|uniref:Uncharacterized protein n=1 Tax=Vibrio phage NF TaxID=2686202 RepID=A0A6B9J187_9CAUD|nr:hypothetical protein PP410_gp44 [Vibrio phage NF]QGZ13261.1 hypothetical protein [Vibrio phage NF]
MMKHGIYPTIVWFVDDGNSWKFWKINGCELHFLTSEDAVLFRRESLKNYLDEVENLGVK